MSRTKKLLSYLQDGNRVTVRQAEVMFNLKNVTATVSNLRSQGYAIFSVPSFNSKGEKKNKYEIGEPTRKMIAAGVKALRAGLVNVNPQ